jgi:hypothetical protein
VHIPDGTGRAMSDDQPTTELRIPTEVYSRIVGYIRPLQAWGQAKQQEFHDRQTFDVPGCEHITQLGGDDDAA